MTKLISDSLERKITFRQRIEMRLHTMMCGMCRRFRKNVIELRKRIRQAKGQLDEPPPYDAKLPLAAKARLEEAVNRHIGQ